ncbi:MAG TPA: AAA family ATPase, partial [Actinomycetota bacterium]|nr:AAA family ATPase [Actinomycetota bacterium]
MRIKRIRAQRFLGFDDLDLELDTDGMNVIVGPNGSGKSNVRRAIELAHAGVRFASWVSEETTAAIEDFADAAHRHDSGGFSVSLDVELTEQLEKEQIATYIRAAVLTQFADDVRQHDNLARADEYLRQLTTQALISMFSGTVTVAREATIPPRWAVWYDFEHARTPYRIMLRGDDTNKIVRRDQLDSASGDRGYLRVSAAIADGFELSEPPSITKILPVEGGRMELLTASVSIDEDLSAVRDFYATFGLATANNYVFGFALPLARIFETAIVVLEDTRTTWERRVPADSLLRRRDDNMKDSPGHELLRLKTGSLAERKRFQELLKTFHELAGAEIDVRVRPVESPHDPDRVFVVDPVVVREDFEIPIHRAGTGIGELLRVLLPLSRTGSSVVFLDEPAANLHPRLQQAVLRFARTAPAQTILVTHSPYMVPAAEPDDMRRVVRLALRGDKTLATRLSDVGDDDAVRKLHQMMTPADTRALLFSDGVILTEGATDAGVLETWLSKSPPVGEAGSPASNNITIHDVGGDQAFGTNARLLDRLGIPWIIISDLPAMTRSSKRGLAAQLGLEDAPALTPTGAKDFFAYWEQHDVFTLCSDGAREIDNALASLDPSVWREA